MAVAFEASQPTSARVEDNWSLPPLGGGATDKRANSIGDMFAF